jgi:hypothetical protein
MYFDERFFEKFGRDFIQRAGRNLGLSNAQLLGLGKDLLALDAKLLC